MNNNNNIQRKLERIRQQLRDNRGCDAMINSCGDKGECCDEHDACYRTNACTARSWLTMGMYFCQLEKIFVLYFSI